MRKGGFNMYMQKQKKSASLYQTYHPRFKNHQDTELSAYISTTVGRKISSSVGEQVRHMAKMIGHGICEGRH